MATKKLSKTTEAASKPRSTRAKVETVVLDGNVVLTAIQRITAALERSEQMAAHSVPSHPAGIPADTASSSPINLPPIEVLVGVLEDKIGTLYGFSGHLRSQVGVEETPQEEFLFAKTLKGRLDRAIRMADCTYDNLVAARNVIT